jgi:hypothetical protein
MMPSMAIALSIFGVTVAAFCLWLAVRVFNRRERWAKWALIGLVLVLAYPLSFGPACWWFSAKRRVLAPNDGTLVDLGFHYAPRIYWPIGKFFVLCPRSMQKMLDWYATLDGHDVMIPTDQTGENYICPSN